MARIRYIKSDFWKDEDIAELPHQTRLFYIGMWNFADKSGRLEDRPKWLKVEIFPYENADTEKILEELCKVKLNSLRPFIQRYACDGKKYIQILSWDEHQKPHHQEQESKIPEPPLMETLTGTITVNGECASNKPGEDTPTKHRTYTEDIKKKKKFDFNSVWEKYPKGNKIGKKEAFGYFNSTVKTDQEYININTALDNYINSKRVKEGFAKDGCNWFDSWEDWVDLKEDFCDKCKGKGKFISKTGYEIICECPAGNRK